MSEKEDGEEYENVRRKMLPSFVDEIKIKTTEDGGLNIKYKLIVNSAKTETGSTKRKMSADGSVFTSTDSEIVVGSLDNYPNHLKVNGRLFLVVKSHHFCQVPIPYFASKN